MSYSRMTSAFGLGSLRTFPVDGHATGHKETLGARSGLVPIALAGRTGALHERVAKTAASCTVPPRITVLGIIASGCFIMSVERFEAQRNERHLSQAVCVVWRLEGAQCVEICSFF
jgi:hypothetical protein